MHPIFSGSLVFAVVYSIPRFYDFEVQTNPDGTLTVNTTAFRDNRYYKTYYVFWSKFILIEMLPYFTILTLNTLILLKTVKATKFRSRFQQQAAASSSGNINSLGVAAAAAFRQENDRNRVESLNFENK